MLDNGSTRILSPRPRIIEVFPTDASYAKPNELLTILHRFFDIGATVSRARVLSLTAGCFDIDHDHELAPDEAPLFEWRSS